MNSFIYNDGFILISKLTTDQSVASCVQNLTNPKIIGNNYILEHFIQFFIRYC